ncbi:hypothetical protein ABEG18_25025 [Alsobacter sp. KACC 23698]|uniref:Aminoglycoside phosphotransferase domain-containing protein n=1 Tax=Alsobacter sp. KACC 23698 TaxID=3149229 RepID=A0AAU7JFC1_9HYPH
MDVVPSRPRRIDDFDSAPSLREGRIGMVARRHGQIMESLLAEEPNPPCEPAAVLALLSARGALVELRETRTSWVFLTPGDVFKLKKPVHDKDLDFRTADARRRNSENEVRLNRRLAPDTYIGVVPVVRIGEALALGGEGRVIDWLVHMKRLPEGLFLDNLARGGRIPRHRVEILAHRLAEFYAAAPTASADPEEYRAQIRREILEARATLSHARFNLSPSFLRRIIGAQLRFVGSRSDPVCRPVEMGRIVEGHGDLRPEHIWLGAHPLVIDCLEFSYGLRCVSPFDELAYLGLECDRLGSGFIGPILIETAAERLGYRPPSALLAFYRSLRAIMRARFSLRHLLEPSPRQPEKWPPLGRAYLRLADRAASELS